MKFSACIFVYVLLYPSLVASQGDSNEVQTKCRFPDDIGASRQQRLHHPCESNQNQQFAIELHDGFYCIFYSVFAIALFGAESKFKIKIDGSWQHDQIGADNFEVSNRILTFEASMQDVTIVISKLKDEDEMPRISSVIIDDGSLPPEAAGPQEFCKWDKCGQTNEAVGIVIGGVEALDGFWPWNAALYYRYNSSLSSFRCGATIINERTLLTTATCLMSGMKAIAAEKVFVAVRETSLFSASGKRLPVKEIKIHDNFADNIDAKNKLKFDFNIGVLILTKDIKFTPQVNSICLPSTTSFEFKEKRGFVVGWGYDESAQLSAKLKQLEVPTFPYLECFYRNRQLFSGFSSKRNFCAGFKDGKGLCFGDAGGGLFIKSGKRYSLVGMSSFSNCHCDAGTCKTHDEAIFSSIPANLQWIHNNMY